MCLFKHFVVLFSRRSTNRDICYCRSDYVPHTVIQRPKPKASSTYITPTETMQLTTTYMRDFKPFSVNKNIVANRTTKHEVPTVKMDTQTLYKGTGTQATVA